MNAFILAGGQSTRMGRDKALLPFHGRPLIEHALASLRALGFSPRIAGSRPDLAVWAPILGDSYPGSGPLAGIEAALSASDADLNLFLPIDMPLLPPDFLRWMTARASETSALATIPHLQGRPQPLCAIYHRDLLAHIKSALAAGDLKVMRAIEHAAVAFGSKLDCFNVETIAACLDFPSDPPVHRWFQNINTPPDLRIADLQIAALEKTPLIQ
ncbi:MAG: molybdenum cofactor guanylyltransferase [Silvibacterium sp.]|nr:molybdenum cofactor guanylyltransferase [Silvibacterium sp.]